MNDPLVRIQLDAISPEDLSPPTSAVRWYVDEALSGWCPVVIVEGTLEDVEAFVRQHWGDEIFDGYFSPDAFMAEHAVGGES
jgi:hypothetical protein